MDFVAHEITKVFQTRAGALRVLDGVSLKLSRGQSVAIVGPSGSGKSTFLHIAGALDVPNSGSIELLGENPHEFKTLQQADFRNRHIGFVFQQHHLLPQLSAIQNVLLPAMAGGAVSSETQQFAQHLLDQVGLADRIHHLPGELSGGEQQRVAVARALIHQPALLLADEPTGSLDRRNADKIGELLAQMQQAHQAMLICVTHSDRLATLFDRLLELQDGSFAETPGARCDE